MYLPLPLFFLLPAIAREDDQRLSLKVYDVINWLKKNSKTHIVLHLDKENRSDTETWSIERVLNKEKFNGKSMQKMCTKN